MNSDGLWEGSSSTGGARRHFNEVIFVAGQYVTRSGMWLRVKHKMRFLLTWICCWHQSSNELLWLQYLAKHSFCFCYYSFSARPQAKHCPARLSCSHKRCASKHTHTHTRCNKAKLTERSGLFVYCCPSFCVRCLLIVLRVANRQTSVVEVGRLLHRGAGGKWDAMFQQCLIGNNSSSAHVCGGETVIRVYSTHIEETCSPLCVDLLLKTKWNGKNLNEHSRWRWAREETLVEMRTQRKMSAVSHTHTQMQTEGE